MGAKIPSYRSVQVFNASAVVLKEIIDRHPDVREYEKEKLRRMAYDAFEKFVKEWPGEGQHLMLGKIQFLEMNWTGGTKEIPLPIPQMEIKMRALVYEQIEVDVDEIPGRS